MKFNYKNQRFINLLVLVVCAGLGVKAGPEVAPLVGGIGLPGGHLWKLKYFQCCRAVRTL